MSNNNTGTTINPNTYVVKNGSAGSNNGGKVPPVQVAMVSSGKDVSAILRKVDKERESKESLSVQEKQLLNAISKDGENSTRVERLMQEVFKGKPSSVHWDKFISALHKQLGNAHTNKKNYSLKKHLKAIDFKQFVKGLVACGLRNHLGSNSSTNSNVSVNIYTVMAMAVVSISSGAHYITDLNSAVGKLMEAIQGVQCSLESQKIDLQEKNINNEDLAKSLGDQLSEAENCVQGIQYGLMGAGLLAGLWMSMGSVDESAMETFKNVAKKGQGFLQAMGPIQNVTLKAPLLKQQAKVEGDVANTSDLQSQLGQVIKIIKELDASTKNVSKDSHETNLGNGVLKGWMEALKDLGDLNTEAVRQKR